MKEADAIGDRLRYGHQGFMANKRQLRMGGLAAIELAQMLRSAVRSPAGRLSNSCCYKCCCWSSLQHTH